MLQVQRRDLCKPSSLPFRPGCPCKITPTYQTSSHLKGDLTGLIQKYVTMRLVHQAKDGTIKNSLLLRAVHEQLELSSALLHNSLQAA
jgi:hypothetical protein